MSWVLRKTIQFSIFKNFPFTASLSLGIIVINVFFFFSLNCFEINCAWVIGQCTGGFDIIIIIVYMLYLIVVVDVVFIHLLLAIAHTKEGKFIASSYYCCCCSCRWMRTKCLNANARCRVRDNFIAPSIDLEVCVCAVIFEIYIHHHTLSCRNFSRKTIKFQTMDTNIY